jgi:hypothetical protein
LFPLSKRCFGAVLLSILPLSAKANSQTGSGSEALADASMYQAFFGQVAKNTLLPDPPEWRQVDRKPSKSFRSVVPSLRDVIGLSDHEADLLTTAAKEYASEAGSLSKHFPLVFEARLQEMENGRISETVASQVSELEQSYREMVLGYVQQLRFDSGDARFQVLDDYVRSSEWKTALLPTRETRDNHLP